MVEAVKRSFRDAPISSKMKSLLAIAAKVQKGGRHVSEADVVVARAEGATDVEIHDTVLIAAAFCMFNRYVQRAGDRGAGGSRGVRRDGGADRQRRLPGAALRSAIGPRSGGLGPGDRVV